MRLAPLIPLALLAVGAATVEFLRLETGRHAAVSPAFELRDTRVASNMATGHISFTAATLHLDEHGARASGVAGTLAATDTANRFRAAFIAAADGTVDLRGDVELWRDAVRLSTAQATIGPDGSLTGGQVWAEGPDGTASAPAFAIGADGALHLRGGIRASLRGR